MKWDKLRKLKRNEMLFKLWKDNPDMSYQEIGDAFGISRIRAFQIIKKRLQREGK